MNVLLVKVSAVKVLEKVLVVKTPLIWALLSEALIGEDISDAGSVNCVSPSQESKYAPLLNTTLITYLKYQCTSHFVYRVSVLVNLSLEVEVALLFLCDDQF